MKAPILGGGYKAPRSRRTKAPRREQSIGTALKMKAPRQYPTGGLKKNRLASSMGVQRAHKADSQAGSRGRQGTNNPYRSLGQAAGPSQSGKVRGITNAISRGQGKKVGLRKQGQVRIQPMKMQGPSPRGSVGLSTTRSPSPQDMVSNAYKGYSSSISRLSQAGTKSSGLRLPSFESHFSFDPLRGIGDTIRQSNPIDKLFDAIGNRIRSVGR